MGNYIRKSQFIYFLHSSVPTTLLMIIVDLVFLHVDVYEVGVSLQSLQTGDVVAAKIQNLNTHK